MACVLLHQPTTTMNNHKEIGQWFTFIYRPTRGREFCTPVVLIILIIIG